MNNYNFGTREKIIKEVLKLEQEVRIIPLHRETKKSMENWSDEYLARYRWELLELKTRGSGQI
jgi:hypothetical protein